MNLYTHGTTKAACAVVDFVNMTYCDSNITKETCQ